LHRVEALHIRLAPPFERVPVYWKPPGIRRARIHAEATVGVCPADELVARESFQHGDQSHGTTQSGGQAVQIDGSARLEATTDGTPHGAKDFPFEVSVVREFFGDTGRRCQEAHPDASGRRWFDRQRARTRQNSEGRPQLAIRRLWWEVAKEVAFTECGEASRIRASAHRTPCLFHQRALWVRIADEELVCESVRITV
jgi:hypothetical protein